MNIINVSKMKTTRSIGEPVIRVTKNKVAFGSRLAQHFKLENEDKIDLEFAMDNETLHVRPTKSENSAEFTKRQNKQWELYSSGLAKYIRDLSGSEDDSIPCRVTNKNKEGWYPVITAYWKTLSNN